MLLPDRAPLTARDGADRASSGISEAETCGSNGQVAGLSNGSVLTAAPELNIP